MIVTDDKAWEASREEILEKVAKEHGISYDQVKEIYKDIFQKSKQVMMSKDMPKVLWHNFGKFSPCVARMNRQIYKWIFKYQDKVITRDRLKENLSFLMPIRSRVKREQRSKRHKKDSIKRLPLKRVYPKLVKATNRKVYTHYKKTKRVKHI